MSTFREITVKCSVCGAESRQTRIMSTNTLGPQDLDMRPPELERSTMRWWVQVCPECGYVASSLEHPAKAERDWLSNHDYTSCQGREFVSPLASKFFRSYLIERHGGTPREAFLSILCAAWSCDDAHDLENAQFCRTLAVAQINELLAGKFDYALTLQKMDILRRAGKFSELIEEFANKPLADVGLRAIRDFQLQKAKERDAGCYTTDDIHI